MRRLRRNQAIRVAIGQGLVHHGLQGFLVKDILWKPQLRLKGAVQAPVGEYPAGCHYGPASQEPVIGFLERGRHPFGEIHFIESLNLHRQPLKIKRPRLVAEPWFFHLL